MIALASTLFLLSSLVLQPQHEKELVVQAGLSGVTFVTRPDGKLIASSSSGGIQLWNSRGRLLRTIGIYGRVNDLALNPKYDLLAFQEKITDLHGNVIHELEMYGGQGYLWSPDGETLAVETTSGVQLFNREGEFLGRTNLYVNVICFSASGKELIGGKADNYNTEGIVHVWDLKGTPLRQFSVGETTRFRYLVPSSDGTSLATGIARRPGMTPGDGPLNSLWTPTGELIKNLKVGSGYPDPVIAGAGGFLTSTGDDIQRWTAKGEPLNLITEHNSIACTDELIVCTLRGSKAAAYKGRWSYRFIDMDGNLIQTLPVQDKQISAVATSPTGDVLACLDASGLVRVWRLTGEMISSFKPMGKAGEAMLALYTGRRMAFDKQGMSLVFYVKEKNPDAEFLCRFSLSGELLIKQPLPYGERSAPEWIAKWIGPGKTMPGFFSVPLPDGQNALEFKKHPKRRPLRDPGGKKVEWGRGHWSYEPSIAFAPDGDKLFVVQGRDFLIRDGRTGEMLEKIEVDFGAKHLAVSPDGKHLAYTGSNERDGTVTLLDTKGNILKRLAHPAVQSLSGIRGPFFTHDGRGIVTGGSNGTVRIWLWEQDQAVTWIFRDEQWIMYTDDGLFDGSRNGGELLGMTLGSESFTVDQFALVYNRPDLMLEILGAENTLGAETNESEKLDGERGLTVTGTKRAQRTRTLVEHYRAQFHRRLKKAGLTEADLEGSLHAPTIEVELVEALDGSAKLKVQAADSLYALKHLYTWVNGVPTLERRLEGKEYAGEVELPLGIGDNNIEVSVLNNRGAESLRSLTSVRHEENADATLHVLALGVSDYLDDDLDLAFADKDAQDLTRVLLENTKGKFDRITTQLFVNEEVTRETVDFLTENMKRFDVNDTFVLFVAGHGVHDTDPDSTWYFLGHEADLNNLSETAIPFEQLEDLLALSPARRKLFLLDACESGELEEDWLAMAPPSGKMRARTSKKLTARASEATGNAAVRSIDRNRYIFYDLLRRSGAIVYSSSRGSEFSYEDPAIQNGWFTEKVLEALSGSADKNNDGWIDSFELRGFVTPQVAQETNGRQHPTVDRDNIHQTVRLPAGN